MTKHTEDSRSKNTYIFLWLRLETNMTGVQKLTYNYFYVVGSCMILHDVRLSLSL